MCALMFFFMNQFLIYLKPARYPIVIPGIVSLDFFSCNFLSTLIEQTYLIQNVQHLSRHKSPPWLCPHEYVCELVAQLCLSLCDSMDDSPPSTTVHGFLWAGILEWVAIPSSGDLSNPGIAPGSPVLQADSLPSAPPGKWLSLLIT